MRAKNFQQVLLELMMNIVRYSQQSYLHRPQGFCLLSENQHPTRRHCHEGLVGSKNASYASCHPRSYHLFDGWDAPAANGQLGA